jgi:hypothetical protein
LDVISIAFFIDKFLLEKCDFNLYIGFFMDKIAQVCQIKKIKIKIPKVFNVFGKFE